MGFWQLGNTSVRSAMRIRDGLVAYSTSGIQGNIRKDSFVDVWENKFEQFRHKRITTNSKCQKCPDYKFCRGDSFHTWDFENNEPKFCIKNVLKGDETNGIR